MASITKSGHKFRLRWTDDDGKPHGTTFARREDAEFHKRTIEVDKLGRKLGYSNVTIPEMPFRLLCEEWLKTRAPQKRSAHHDRSVISFHLLPHFQSISISKINQRSADHYQVHKTHLAVKTVHNHLTLLLAMLNWAHRSGWLQFPPKIKRPKLKISNDFRFLKTKDVARRFLEAAKKIDQEAYTLYATAIFAGLRAGEVAGLLRSKIDLQNRLLVIDRSYNGPTKSELTRYVPILDELLPILAEWMANHSSMWVFPNSVGKMRQPSDRIFQETFQRVLQDIDYEKAFRRGKIRFDLTFHDLRHTFASHWVMDDGNLFKLQRMLGHQSIHVTDKYSHLSRAAYKDDLHRLSGIVPPQSSDCRLQILKSDQSF